MHLLNGRLSNAEIPRLVEFDFDASAEATTRLFLSIDPTQLKTIESLDERIKSADACLAAA